MTAHPSAIADVLIVGGGPAGAAAAIRLADAGKRVLIVERDPLPRPPTRGELLTPRAITAAEQLGIDLTDIGHRIDHVRMTYEQRGASTRLPTDAGIADHGLVTERSSFDERVLRAATDRGTQLLAGHTAVEPIVERGFVRGAHVTDPTGIPFELRAEFTVVADGANSRFGRALGTFREPAWPHALAHTGVYRSPLNAASEIELVVGIRDRAGTPVTGYGWMFPRGDGLVSIGIIVMSTSPSFRVINPSRLLDRFVSDNAERWLLDPVPVIPSVGGRLPMGGSIKPNAGPTYLVVGDAAGVANPLTGAGVGYALETGSVAGGVLTEALDTHSAAALQRYPKLLDDAYGQYFKVGRLASRFLGNSRLNRRLGRLGATRSGATETLVRLGIHQLRAGTPGTAEIAYRIGQAISYIAPNS